MTHSSELIILASTKIGEKAVVLHCLTPGWGRRSFICTVSRTAPMSLFLPLNILNGEVHENTKSDLWRVNALTVAHPLSGIRGNIFKNTMTLFMSEVLYRTIKDGANEEGLFDWCRKSILTLDAMESDFANYHLRFLLELAGALGFRPDMEGLAPFAGDRFGEIRDLLSLGFAESMLLPLNGESRNEIAEILVRYLSYHTESAITVRSLPVLRELYR